MSTHAVPKTKLFSPSPLILASASPRRAELLRNAGYTFTILPAPIEEPSRRPPSIPIGAWPTALAYIKAYATQQTLAATPPENHKPHSGTHPLETRNWQLETPPPTLLGADTIVLHGNRILGKPRDRSHARQMLRRLSGQRHVVITGLVLLQGDRFRFSRAISVCRIKTLSNRWLDAYLDSNLWQGKAGAYGIQDDHDPFVTLLSGEWSNVVGLPLTLLASELNALNTLPQD